MTAYARHERRQLAGLLLELGPDQPTLCEGWTTRDLAAHLVVRERRPDAAAAQLLPPLRGYAERLRLAKAAQPYGEILEELRRPPRWSPLSSPPLDEAANTIEFFVHHEDARRAQDEWAPRHLDDGEQAAIWRQVRLTGRLVLRRTGVPVTVLSDGFGAFSVGSRPRVTLSGPPGELALFVTGRKDHARVALEGDEQAAARLRGAKLGF